MGHEIIATAKETNTEIAEISFNAFNTTAQTLLYTCLNAQDCNNLCSGSGDFKEYTKEDIQKSLSMLEYLETEDLSGFEKKGKNPIQDLLGILTDSEVLPNGELIANQSGPKIVKAKSTRTEEQDLIFQAGRVRQFLTQILDSGYTPIEIDFN